MSLASSAAMPAPSSDAIPHLVVVEGTEQRVVPITKTPFAIGRRTGKDLVIPDPLVSRDHAEIHLEGEQFFIIDQNSKHGTFVNGAKVTAKQKLNSNDRIELGDRNSTYVIFNPDRHDTNPAREFLSQLAVNKSTTASDLEKLTFFLEAARKLNTAGVLEEILITLVETTLRVTGAERGFVYACENGNLRLVVGRNAKGQALAEDSTISHSLLYDSAKAGSEFVISDTSASSEIAERKSIIANELRTVICIPLRKRQMGGTRDVATANGRLDDVRAVLYLDSRYASKDFNKIGGDILRAISTEAAALLENASLVQAEESARRYQQELSIAASIQQRLLTVNVPNVPFARVAARNIPCKDIGGDFFDAVWTDEGLCIVVADVCGKGISAALLASVLQGMIYSQLVAKVPLKEVASSANRYLCQKGLGEKYATLLVAKIHPDGEVEYVNCGHVPPVLVTAGQVSRPPEGNLPVGLMQDAVYESGRLKLGKNDKLLIVTDGVTEAEDAQGEFFGNERLEKIALEAQKYEDIFQCIHDYCGDVPLNDDCTVLELQFTA